jgi:hypothetical protein
MAPKASVRTAELEIGKREEDLLSPVMQIPLARATRCPSQNAAGETPLKLSREFVAVLATGVCVGVAVTQGIHAQQTKEPPAYIIAEVEKDASKPQDTEAARRYAEEAPKSLLQNTAPPHGA